MLLSYVSWCCNSGAIFRHKIQYPIIHTYLHTPLPMLYVCNVVSPFQDFISESEYWRIVLSSGVKRQVSIVRCQTSGVKRQVSSVLCQASGVRCQASGVKDQVSSVGCQTSGVKRQVSRIRYQASGAKRQVGRFSARRSLWIVFTLGV